MITKITDKAKTGSAEAEAKFSSRLEAVVPQEPVPLNEKAKVLIDDFWQKLCDATPKDKNGKLKIQPGIVQFAKVIQDLTGETDTVDAADLDALIEKYGAPFGKHGNFSYIINVNGTEHTLLDIGAFITDARMNLLDYAALVAQAMGDKGHGVDKKQLTLAIK